MATVAEQLAAHKARKAGPTVADQLAARQGGLDRSYESEVLRGPPADAPSDYVKPQPSMPAGYRDRNAVQPAAPSPVDDLVRALTIGTQGAGRGIAGLLGLPVDMAEIGLNAGGALSDMALGTDLPRFNNSPGSSNSIANVAGKGTEAILGDVLYDQEEMSPNERIRYRANQFGTESAVGGGIISKFRNVLPRALSAPYEAKGSEARVLLGDTGAGVGSGVAMQSYDEYAPDAVKDNLGVFGELIAGLLGGIGGANTTRLAKDPTKGVRGSLNVPEGMVPRDPETMLPIKQRDLGRAAALYQQRATDPAAAAKSIEDYLASVSGSPNPTTALLSDDPGLLSLERKLRTGDAAPDFGAADRAVMDSASESISGLRPEGANPQAARDMAAGSIEEMLAEARRRVSEAQNAATQQDAVLGDLAGTVAGGRGADQASRDLDRVLVDETYIPARTEKNRLYEDAASAPGAVVGTQGARSAAEAEAARIGQTNPVLRDPKAASVADAFAAPNGAETRPLADVLQDRKALGTVASEARAKGDFERADTAQTVKRGINEDIDAAAASGAPGTEKLAAADVNYKERFAPYFRNGTVSPKFFEGIDRDMTRGSTPPEATAGKFLMAGPTSRAAAKDVADILSISPSSVEGRAAATEYVMADAVSKGVVKNGKVDENALARFMAQREGMLSQLPETKAAFDKLLADVRSGNVQASKLADDLAQAMSESKLTQKQIDQGVLSLVADSDPRKAVASVFSSKDPAAAMDEAVTAFKDVPEAAAGWKAAVADYLIEKVTTASKAAVSDANDTVSLPALRRLFDQNEAALSKVFSADEMSALQQVRKKLEVMSNRGAQASSGSATAENMGGLRGVIRDLAGPAGFYTMMSRGALMAGSVERRIKMVADQFPDADATAIKLIKRAQFDPELAKLLLDFPTSDAQIYTWTRKLNRLLVAAGAEGSDE